MKRGEAHRLDVSSTKTKYKTVALKANDVWESSFRSAY